MSLFSLFHVKILRARIVEGTLKGAVICACLGVGSSGCTLAQHRRSVDARAQGILAEKQQEALGRTEPLVLVAPEDSLRARLLIAQQLPYAAPASLGEVVRPGDSRGDSLTADALLPPGVRGRDLSTPLELSLNEALQVAAANSPDYQDRKEDLFEAALDLDLERDDFRTSFAGVVSSIFSHDRSELGEPGGRLSEAVETSAVLEAARTFRAGTAVTLQLGWDLLKLLEPEQFLTRGFTGDASIAIPLLRGAGPTVAAENLTQAERNARYAIYSFEDFKRAFAVQVAGDYLAVLQREDQVMNAAENYRGLIAATRRARRLLDAGNLPPIQVDQAIQDELNARNRWISAVESQTAALDAFKTQLGLPADAAVTLDRAEFQRLSEASAQMVAEPEDAEEAEIVIPPADEPIVLEEPSAEGGGVFEMDPDEAVRLAFAHRLDLRGALERVEDAQRRIRIAADALKPGLRLLGRAGVGAARLQDASFDRGQYSAELELDLPLERTSAAVSYRQSLINLEQAVRTVQAVEDDIKLGVRERLRTLREARESLQIQGLSVELARRRVRGADLNLQAGRVPIRDLLEAQEDLLSAQNALTAAAVSYRLAELELQRDLGVLQVGPDGLWTEFNPQANEAIPTEN